ncbi:hypothetical protein [Flavobacterium sp.]
MYNFIQKFHSGWAYLALLLLFIAAANSLVGHLGRKEFTPRDRKIALFALIAVHIQFLVGLILYFVSPKGLDSFGEMKNAALRLTSLEHPLINLIAIALITIGWSKHKRAQTSELKFKPLAFLYSIALVLILIRLPWQSWLK